MEQVQVISRDTIPPVKHDRRLERVGELRELRNDDRLREFLSATEGLSVSWVSLAGGEAYERRAHSADSLFLVYAGSGAASGADAKPLEGGDVVVVPAGREFGLVAGPAGLRGLSFRFGAPSYAPAESVPSQGEGETLEGLLAYNSSRLQEWLQRPIFALLTSGALDDPGKRKAYLQTLQIWVDGNQTLLFGRQASCFEPTYKAMFLQHMGDEMGHDALHRERAGGPVDEDPSPHDPVMDAITNWFAYQMHVLDNAEKTAVIHLVIENASAAYHARAMPALAKYTNQQYFDVHVEADHEHAAMGTALLERESSQTYARLKVVVAQAWDMVGAMVDRVAEVTQAT